MRFRFSLFGEVFATRPRGAKVRAQVEEVLRTTPDDEALVLDCEGVQLMSYSFADEVIGMLLLARAAGTLGERAILLTSAGEEVLSSIVLSLERRKLILPFLTQDGIRLVGAPEHLNATFVAAFNRGEFRVTELAEDLGITTHALNNRLKALLGAGIVVRRVGIPSAGGREYIYRVVVPAMKGA